MKPEQETELCSTNPGNLNNKQNYVQQIQETWTTNRIMFNKSRKPEDLYRLSSELTRSLSSLVW